MTEILALLTLMSVVMISGLSAWVVDQNQKGKQFY